MTRRRRARTTLATTALVLGVVTACAVPTNEEPVELSGSVPFGLLDTTTTTSTTSPDAAPKEVNVYLLASRDGTTALAKVQRTVDVSAGVQEVLANLFTQPPGPRHSTAIPESATLLSATPAQSNPRRLIVDVRGLFGSIQGEALRDALAQIVWTATEPGTGIDEVIFHNDGERVQALIDDLESTEGAVRRSDYTREN